MFRSALLLVSGNAFGSLLSLVRNLVVARLISVEDYGIAATFAISMSIVEMMTSLGLQQLLIQDRDGDDPRLQSGLQGFHLLRSIFSASVLFLLAHPIASFLGIEDIAWAYQILALVPLITGLMHFDLYRMQRRMVYLPSILSTSVPNLISVLAIWPLWTLYGDYRVMLYAVMLQSVLTVIMSHLVAKRPYRPTLYRDVIAKSIKFGWPLLVNNALLFLIFQGEKIIVGRVLGLEDLAIFAMGFTLTLTPALVLASSSQSFFLPQLAARKDTRAQFDPLAMVTLQSHLFFGGLFVIAVMFFAEPVVYLLLSAKYASLVPLMVWMAILQGFRLFRGGGATIGLAMGRTGLASLSNLPRLFSMPVAWYFALITHDVFVVLWIAIAGEIIGFVVSLILMKRQLGISLGTSAASFWLMMGVVLCVAVQAWLSNRAVDAPQLSLWTSIPIVIFFTLALWHMKDLRRYVAARKSRHPLL